MLRASDEKMPLCVQKNSSSMENIGPLKPKISAIFTAEGTFSYLHQYDLRQNPELCGFGNKDEFNLDNARECMIRIHEELSLSSGICLRTEQWSSPLDPVHTILGYGSHSWFDKAIEFVVIFNTIWYIIKAYRIISEKCGFSTSAAQDFEWFMNNLTNNAPDIKAYIVWMEESCPMPNSMSGNETSRRSGSNRRISAPVPRSISSMAPPPSFNWTRLICPVGRNGSEIFEGKHDQTLKCAVKIIPDTNLLANRELDTMKSLEPHPNKIGYLTSFKYDGKTYIKMELAQTNLKSYIYDMGGDDVVTQPDDLSEAEMCLQITAGVKHIHKSGFSHGDLTPDNIFVTHYTYDGAKHTVKLGDFSLSCRRGVDFNVDAWRTHLRNPLGWYAPEIVTLDSSQFEGFLKADIYTLGWLIRYVLCRGYSYDRDILIEKVREAIRANANHETRIKESLWSFFLLSKDLLNAMTAENPEDRPSIECVAKHSELWTRSRRVEFKNIVSDILKRSEGIASRQRPKRMSFDAIREGDQAHMKVLAQSNNIEQETELITEAQKISLEMRKSILKYTKEICRAKHWTKLLPYQVREHVKEGWRKYNNRCPIDLLRLSRNLFSHFHDQTDDLLRAVGKNYDELEDFFEKRFPMLVPCIYRALQPYKNLPELAEFYDQNEDLKYDLPEYRGPS